MLSITSVFRRRHPNETRHPSSTRVHLDVNQKDPVCSQRQGVLFWDPNEMLTKSMNRMSGSDFKTKADMALSDNSADGAVATVDDGANGEREHFGWIAMVGAVLALLAGVYSLIRYRCKHLVYRVGIEPTS